MVKRKKLEKSAITAPSSSKKKKRADLPFLPIEVIREILIWLPGNFLGSTIRYVCEAWSKIVHDPNFVESHPRRLLSSTTGLIIPERISSTTGIILQEDDKQPCSTLYFQIIEQGRVGVTDLNLQLSHVLARCEGALLGYHTAKNLDGQFVWRLRVVNLMTLEVHEVSPPPMTHLAWDYHNEYKRLGQLSCIAQIPGNGEIKIICLCNSGLENQSYRWMVSTIGTDESWRRIDYEVTQAEYYNSGYWADSVSLGGVVYTGPMNGCPSWVYAIDLRSEHVEKIPMFTKPADCLHSVFTPWENSFCCFLYFGKGIKAMALDLEKKEWIEKDCFGSEIGRKICEDRATPVSWSNEGNILIAMKRKYGKLNCYVLIAYNMKTGRRKGINNVFISTRSVFPLAHSAFPTLMQ